MDGPSTLLSIPIKRLPHGLDLPLPTRQSPDAAGMDLYAAVAGPTTLPPHAIQLIPCGFAVAIPAGWEGQVRPRSGLATKFGVTLINGVGTIDADYRGEVMVPLINHGHAPFTIERGMRIAQLLIAPVPKTTWVETDNLDDTSRGAGGFGSTGHAAPK